MLEFVKDSKTCDMVNDFVAHKTYNGISLQNIKNMKMDLRRIVGM